MRTILACATLALAPSTVAMGALAESLSVDAFQIEIGDGWAHLTEPAPASDPNRGDSIRIHNPNGSGVLDIGTYASHGPVQPEVLRNLTNLPLTIPLTLQRWGDFSGYQHDYVEGTSFLRQWWLANDSVVIFVTYRCDVEMRELETDAIDAMVRSLSAG
jgi:hypothetical protein